MQIEKLQENTEKDFNNVICLMSVIPLLVSVYIIAAKLASLRIFVGEIGYIMLLVMAVVLIGIIAGKRMLWDLIQKIFDFHHRVLSLQQELLEKNRLAAITETVLTLGHEINNPLMVVHGNLELLKSDVAGISLPISVKNRLNEIRNNCERMISVTQKMSNLSKPVSATVHGNTKIIDLSQSE